MRTHLGHLLHPGDTALGYDLTRANFVDDELESFVQKGNTLPDVVLVSSTQSQNCLRAQQLSLAMLLGVAVLCCAQQVPGCIEAMLHGWAA